MRPVKKFWNRLYVIMMLLLLATAALTPFVFAR